MVWWEWLIYLLVNWGIGYCYQAIPAKLSALLSSSHYLESTLEEIVSYRAHNVWLLKNFIRWCGIHHYTMVPQMYLLMSGHTLFAWSLIGVDSVVLVVSWHALRNIVIPNRE